jgi:hypothetical protein
VLNAIAASGAALCTALITASNIDRLWGGRRIEPKLIEGVVKGSEEEKR